MLPRTALTALATVVFVSSGIAPPPPACAGERLIGADAPRPTDAAIQGGLRLGFIENQGQFDDPVRFAVRGRGVVTYLTGQGMIWNLVAPVAPPPRKGARRGERTRVALDLDVTNGKAHVEGATMSTNFPVTLGASRGYGIDAHGSGDVFVAGFTNIDSMPVQNFEVQTTAPGSGDGFALRLKHDGASVVWCSLLGGTQEDTAMDIVAAPNGAAYVTGFTFSDGPFDDPPGE